MISKTYCKRDNNFDVFVDKPYCNVAKVDESTTVALTKTRTMFLMPWRHWCQCPSSFSRPSPCCGTSFLASPTCCDRGGGRLAETDCDCGTDRGQPCSPRSTESSFRPARCCPVCREPPPCRCGC